VNYLFNISAILLSAIDRYQHFRKQSGILAKLAKNYFILKHLVFTVITGSDIDPSASLGERLSLPHPNGVVIHRDAVIGDDCMIMQQVTIGQVADGRAPVLGNGVYVGAGAKILGGVKIGDRARIGANSVVLCDVPAGKTAVGIPAKVIP
jgi:serine O-acetyltransferase